MVKLMSVRAKMAEIKRTQERLRSLGIDLVAASQAFAESRISVLSDRRRCSPTPAGVARWRRR